MTETVTTYSGYKITRTEGGWAVFPLGTCTDRADLALYVAASRPAARNWVRARI